MAETTATPHAAETQDDYRRLVVNIPEALLSALRSSCAAKAEVSLLGRIQGKHPGLKALTAWARETLHPTLALLSLKANNLFEVTFTSTEGRIHALTQTDLQCETATIAFSSWRPHYDSKTPQEADQLDYPIWVQIVDLCQVLRDETFLQTIGSQMGQVIAIDSSEAYRAKLFGPRIRILVKDLNTLPHTVVLPRLDGEGEVEYTLEYSGMPNQCGRCRSREHQVRHCPRKETKSRKREWPLKPNINVEDQEQSPHRGTPRVQTPTAAIPTEQEQQHTTEAESTPQVEGRSQTLTEEPDIGLPTDIEAALRPTEVNFPPLPSPTPKPTQQFPPTITPTPASPNLQPTAEPTLLHIPSTPLPKLPSPTANKPAYTPQTPIQPTSTPTPRATPETPIYLQTPATPTPAPRTSFVWCAKTDDLQQSKGKGKLKTQPKPPESAPITRQGYRTGRLAEDFWTAVGMPNTPHAHRKKLKVIPVLMKAPDQREYLIEKKLNSYTPIAIAHVAEILAGIPWTMKRARQHVVNELSQALHKVLIFGNNSFNPIQQWNQGQWFSEWAATPDGEYNCTLYAIIVVTENKVKIRKGKNLEWRHSPTLLKENLAGPKLEDIQELGSEGPQWKEFTGWSDSTTSTSTSTPTRPFTEVSTNPFSVLCEEDTSS